MSDRAFPANVPPKLAEAFEAAGGNYNELARRLGVNKAHVWNLMVRGKEPKRKDLRRKLFLPGVTRAPAPGWVRETADRLANLEQEAAPGRGRLYGRGGKRIR